MADSTTQNAIITITNDATSAVVESEDAYQDKLAAVIDIAATQTALNNEKLQKTIVDNKERELKNKSEAEKIHSATTVNDKKTAREKSLFNRYEYIYQLFGITKEIPGFQCLVILCLYAVFGTLYAVVIGIPFMIVSLLVDSLATLFRKINNLTVSIWSGLKYIFMGSAIMAVFAIIGLVFYILIKLFGGIG